MMKMMPFVLLIFATILRLCNFNQTKPMDIKNIEDIYAKRNDGIPNENIFLIENFANNIEGVISILNHAKNTTTKMMPLKKENGIVRFIFNKNDVSFDDGAYSINVDSSILIHLNNETQKFKAINIYIGDNLPFKFTEQSSILISYEKFDLNVFKTFLYAIKQERNKIKYNYLTEQFEVNGEKIESLMQEYKLINGRDSNIACIVQYDSKSSFTVQFP